MNITKDQADKVIVPLAFVQAFNTLAHNYSLTAVPPDYYSGTEADAFKSAYKRCGHDLAQIRAMLGENPTIMRGLAEDAEPVCSPTLTECPRCKNDILKCDGAFAATSPQAVQTEAQEREAFEAWIAKDCGDLKTFGEGSNKHYLNMAVNHEWIGWMKRAGRKG